MSDGYSVLMAELLEMARTFGTESQTLSTAVGSAGVSTVDGGDATIDGALSAALEAAGLATGQLSAVVDEHGKELSGACERYRDAEQDSARLCHDLTSLITGK